MASRVIWGLLLVVPFLFLTMQSLPWILLCFAVIHFAAQLEFSALGVELGIGQRIVHAGLSTAVWLILSLVLLNRLPAALALLALTAIAFGYAIRTLLLYEGQRDYQRWLRLLNSLLLVTLPLAFATAVAAWPGGFPYYLLLIGASWGADTGAIFAGKLCGRTPVSPRLSPGKTLEGAIGGALTAGLIYAGAGWLYSGAAPWETASQLPEWLLVAVLLLWGAALSLLGFFGDLVFSLHKRVSQIKDYGKSIPGHGGVLDRFDSMLFVAPALFIFCWILG